MDGTLMRNPQYLSRSYRQSYVDRNRSHKWCKKRSLLKFTRIFKSCTSMLKGGVDVRLVMMLVMSSNRLHPVMCSPVRKTLTLLLPSRNMVEL